MIRKMLQVHGNKMETEIFKNTILDVNITGVLWHLT